MTLQAFIDKWNGEGIDVDGYPPSNPFQCVDLYRKYCSEVLEIPQSPGVTGAVEIWDTYLKDKLDKIENTLTAVPQKGDIVIWAMKTYGHVAVYTEGDVNSFKSFDQNYPVGSKCHIQSHNYNGVLGWLRPKGETMPENTMSDDEKRSWAIVKLFKETTKKIKDGNYEGAASALVGAFKDNEENKKQVAILEELRDNLLSEKKLLEGEIRQLQKNETSWQTKLETANKLVKNLEGKLDAEVALKNKYKGYYEKALLKSSDKLGVVDLLALLVKRIIKK